jgi:hypothetical protein
MDVLCNRNLGGGCISLGRQARPSLAEQCGLSSAYIHRIRANLLFMLPFTRLQRLHSPVFAPANLIRSSLLGGGIDVWTHADRVNELQGHTGYT